MKDYDVVILTDSRYVNPEKSNPYIANVLKEDRLVQDALEGENLKIIKKDWNDSSFNWSEVEKSCPTALTIPILGFF